MNEDIEFIYKFFKGDRVIWLVFIALSIFSIIEVYSSASTLTYNKQDYYKPIEQHIQYVLAGFILIRIIIFTNFGILKQLSFVFLPVAILLLLYTLLRGDSVNGASRTFSLMGIPIQASELSKPCLLMWVSYFLEQKDDEGFVTKKAFWMIVAGVGIVCLLILPENLSTAILIGVAMYLLMWVGRIRTKWLLSLMGGAALVVILLGGTIYNLNKHGVNVPLGHRVSTWVSRLESRGDGKIKDQRRDGNIAMASGGLLGEGLGMSTQREHLSQAYSDFSLISFVCVFFKDMFCLVIKNYLGVPGWLSWLSI